MQRTTTNSAVSLATVVAAAAVWFWALRPLGFASYLSATGTGEEEIIRQYWPHRLVEPEWVGSTPDRLLNWHLAEARLRLAVVAALWLLTAGFAIHRFIKQQRAGGSPTIGITNE